MRGIVLNDIESAFVGTKKVEKIFYGSKLIYSGTVPDPPAEGDTQS